MRARIIRAYIVKPKNIPLISLISQQTVPRDKRDKRVIFPLDSHIYARTRAGCTTAPSVHFDKKNDSKERWPLSHFDGCNMLFAINTRNLPPRRRSHRNGGVSRVNHHSVPELPSFRRELLEILSLLQILLGNNMSFSYLSNF